MKKEIRNRADLKMEIARLKEERHIREKMMKERMQVFGEQLKPVNLLKSAFRSVTSDKELKSEMTARGIEAALGFVLSNLLFKNANPLIRTAASLFGTTAAVKFFGDDGKVYVDKVRDLYDKFREIMKKNKESSEFNEEDIYS